MSRLHSITKQSPGNMQGVLFCAPIRNTGGRVSLTYRTSLAPVTLHMRLITDKVYRT